MLGIPGSICHGQVIHALIKSNMRGQFDYVGINIIVEHISGVMLIISKEDSFGDTILQLGFSLSRGSNIDTKSKGPNGEEVLSIGCSFLKWRINCIRLWKVIGKLDSMVQGMWKKQIIQVGSSQNSLYRVS